MATTPTVTWHIRGTVLIACNCAYGCPCNFNAPPTHGHCEGGWTWHIEQGHFSATSLDGINFSMMCDWPGAIHEGNGEAIVLIDERADRAQRDALLELLSGRVGGPWAILGGTLETVHEPRYLPYEIELNEQHSAVRAGETVTLDMTTIRNPVTGAEVHPKAVLPEGFVTREATLAASSTFRVEDGVAYDHSGNYAASGPFDYRSA